MSPSPSNSPNAPARETAYSEAQAAAYDDKRFTSPAGRRIHALERDILLEALRLVEKSSRILEVGCGTGRLLLDARKAGYNVGGLDASPHMLEQLNKKIDGEGGTFEMVVGEAARTGSPDDTFDFVYAIRLLNQTESPAYALDVVSEMLRITRPGGYVLAEFVNGRRPRWGDNKRQTTRLTPEEVIERGQSAHGQYIRCRGAFFLSMQAYNSVPGWLVPLVASLDRALSRLMPRLCSRCYVLLRRTA